MSRIIRFGIFSAFLIANLLFVFDSCTEAPSNPYQTSNAKIFLMRCGSIKLLLKPIAYWSI
jgi:hypothetical protein